MSAVSLESRITASADVLARQIESDTVLLGMQRAEYFGLNPTGTRVWQLVQQPRRVSEIIDTMVTEYEVERRVLEADVMAIVEDLIAQGLVSVI